VKDFHDQQVESLKEFEGVLLGYFSQILLALELIDELIKTKKPIVLPFLVELVEKVQLPLVE
jgi:hypothetical protein